MGKMLRYSKIPVLAFFATLVVGLLVFYGVQEADVAEAQSSTPTPAASPSPEPSPTVAVSDSSCIDCHTDQETLMATAEEEVETENLSEGEGWGGSVPPLEGWEKVFISDETFLDSIHGQQGCVNCHGGNGDLQDKEEAHEGVRREPDSIETCGQCHGEIVLGDANSLHTSLRGYNTVMQQRASPETWPHVQEAFENHCLSCHTSCGQCHVSRPTNLGGGLTSGHQFKQVPPMNLTCTGCHGSRVEMEYKGRNEGIPADVHWRQGGMPCFECHTQEDMHAMGDFVQDTRYDGPKQPACTDCHPDVAETGSPEHMPTHLEKLACQTCHVADYKNCYSCHVQLSEDGVPFFQIEESVMDVKIGRNPIKSEERPWDWVILRHAPIDPNSFEYYGDNLLPNFDERPTWLYATPHNIQRVAPQAEECNNCHGNPDVFLTEDDLRPEEVEANADVVVDEADIPAAR